MFSHIIDTSELVHELSIIFLITEFVTALVIIYSV